MFITTHSTGFIDTCKSNSVILVKKKENIEIQKLSENELSEVISELGINISTLLLSKILVFVEGPTDEYILKNYLEKNMINSEFGFILMNGVGNYKYYSNANSLELLSSRGLQTIFLLDSDSRNKEEVDKIIKNHPQFSKVHTVSGRCIENLFLDAEIIEHFLIEKQKKSSAKSILPDKQKIENDLQNIIESLYPETVKLHLMWQYLKPIYPKPAEIDISSLETAMSSVRGGIINIKELIDKTVSEFDEKFDESLKSFNESWASNKALMVPGDKVIDEICKLYNLRYKKTKEDAELLSEVALECNKYPKQLIAICNELIKQINSVHNTILG